ERIREEAKTSEVSRQILFQEFGIRAKAIEKPVEAPVTKIEEKKVSPFEQIDIIRAGGVVGATVTRQEVAASLFGRQKRSAAPAYKFLFCLYSLCLFPCSKSIY
ncbi:unnamed protein product, partial [marine sediment metagenome]